MDTNLDERECLFEQHEKQTPELKAICDKWGEIAASEGLSYEDCKNFLKEVEAIGYTFEYYLDAEPYELRPIESDPVEDYLFDMSIPAEAKNMNCGAIHEKPF